MLSEEKKKVAAATALEKLKASRKMKRGCAKGTISKPASDNGQALNSGPEGSEVQRPQKRAAIDEPENDRPCKSKRLTRDTNNTPAEQDAAKAPNQGVKQLSRLNKAAAALKNKSHSFQERSINVARAARTPKRKESIDPEVQSSPKKRRLCPEPLQKDVLAGDGLLEKKPVPKNNGTFSDFLRLIAARRGTRARSLNTPSKSKAKSEAKPINKPTTKPPAKDVVHRRLQPNEKALPSQKAKAPTISSDATYPSDIRAASNKQATREGLLKRKAVDETASEPAKKAKVEDAVAEEPAESRRSSLATKIKKFIPRGLRNQRAKFCSANAVVQCILPTFTARFTQKKATKEGEEGSSEAAISAGEDVIVKDDFVELIGNLNEEDDRSGPVDPTKFIGTYEQLARQTDPNFDGQDHQDAAEFFHCFIDKLAEEEVVATSTGGTPQGSLGEIFKPTIATVKTCSSCFHQCELPVEEPWTLLCQTPATRGRAPIQEYIDGAFQQPEYPNRNLTCPQCQKKGMYVARTLRQAREMVVVELGHDQGYDGRPLTKKVGLTMDIKFKEDEQHDSVSYRMQAMAMHKGDSAREGHYFSFAKRNGQWYKFDDAWVSEVSEDTVLSASDIAHPKLVFFQRV